MDFSALRELEARSVMATYRRQEVCFVRGQGCYLWDSSGKRYLDLVSGIAVVSLGHSHPAWVRAVCEQACKLAHVSNLYYTEPMVELADELCSLSGMEKVFFCNSGAEANEAALKIARKWGRALRGGNCCGIVALERAFHGRTLGSLSATHNPKYREPFAPLLPGVKFAAPGDLAAVENLLDGSVCAVFAEPIQGEAGVWALDRDYLAGLRRICSSRSVLLIFDEVQTGIGRTGEWFAFQGLGVVPDMVTVAKGLGGGFPVGACLAGHEAAGVLTFGDHGSTFAASPLASAAALAVLDVIKQERLLGNALEMGEYFAQELAKLCRGSKIFKSVRGRGLMIAVETGAAQAKWCVDAALRRGLVINNTGENTLRLLPPLIIKREQVDEALELLRAVEAELA